LAIRTTEMARKRKYQDINEIIDQHLKPLLKSECARLGVPEIFVEGIYGVYPEPFGSSSCCEPVPDINHIQKVRIRIDSEIRNPGEAVRHFWHEMRHAKDLYENKRPSELVASLYSLKRCLQEPCRLINR